MALIILATILILGIALYQVVQGVFSSLIMAILSLLCAMIAFNFYEPFAEALLYSRQPATADAIALVALFVLPLLAVRILADRFIPGNVVFGMWADRILGGLLGIFSGMVLVGVLAVAAQMLPFGKSVLGYVPFEDNLTERKQRLWPFLPDEFVLGAVKMCSAGALSSEREYGRAHDDLLKELFCARNKLGRHARVDARPDSLKVVRAFEVPDADVKAWATDGDKGALSQKTNAQRIYVVRVQVDEYVREEKGSKAVNWWVLPATHFRLVTANGTSHYPVAYLWHHPEKKQWHTEEAKLENGRPLIAQLFVGRKWDSKKKALIVDWVYLINEADRPGLEIERLKGKPRAYVVFRRVAKDSVAQVVPQMPDPEDALEPLLPPERHPPAKPPKKPPPATKPAATQPTTKPAASPS